MTAAVGASASVAPAALVVPTAAPAAAPAASRVDLGEELLRVVSDRTGYPVDMLGLDLKEDVVAECAALAERLGAEGLRFAVGDIAGADAADRADLVVSLHACDSATDAALAKAVEWEAEVILAVPCCQHELLSQLDNATLAPLLRHGVLRERFAAEVTDAARAQLLGLAELTVYVAGGSPTRLPDLTLEDARRLAADLGHLAATAAALDW